MISNRIINRGTVNLLSIRQGPRGLKGETGDSTDSRQIIAILPPLPSNGFDLPFEGLEWFDPSDGATSVWMWLVAGVEATETDGVFISQFPTPADTGLPDGGFVDADGTTYLTNQGEYLILSET